MTHQAYYITDHTGKRYRVPSDPGVVVREIADGYYQFVDFLRRKIVATKRCVLLRTSVGYRAKYGQYVLALDPTSALCLVGCTVDEHLPGVILWDSEE